MDAILSITLPIFATIGLGFLCVRRGMFAPADLRPMSVFVMNVALPALLFNAVATNARTLSLTYVAAYGAGSLAALAAGLVWFRLRGDSGPRVPVAAMGMTMPNSANVGYPLMLLAHPDVAREVLAMNALVENLLLLPLCLALIEASRGGTGRGFWRGLAGALPGMLRRPLMLGLLAGGLVLGLGIPVPPVVTRWTGLLGSAAAALALFYIGGSLAGLSLRGNRALAAQIVAGKLLLHPLLVAGALALLLALGLPGLTAELRLGLILTAALPTFGIYAMLAGESGQDGIASIALLASTAASFVTLSLLLWLL